MEWSTAAIGELATFSQGFQVGLKEQKNTPDEGYVRFIRIVDYTQNTTDIRYVKDPGDKYKVDSEDIVMVRYGTPGLIGRGKSGVIANNLFKIQINEPNLTNDYLEYFLSQSHIQEYLSTQGSATMPALNFGQLKTVKIEYPPIPEQKRIVAILDQAFADIEQARAKTEQNLKNARELFESYLQQVFSQRGGGWVESTLGEVTGGIYTGPFGSLLHKSDYIENGIPLVNPAHITALGIEVDNRKTVSKETAERLSSYIMEKGDVVIGRRGEMGRCALVTSQESGFLCGTGSFFIKSSSRCDSGYLVRYLRSASCVARLEKIAGGAVMPNLSNKDLSNFAILLPPIEKQIEILELIDILSEETEKVALTYQKKLDSLDELKKSILQKAFSGKLTKTLEVDTNKGAVA
jgi:type I restriction enzyme S subunit